MSRTVRRRLGTLCLTFATALLAILAIPIPAAADVDSVTGGGFAAQATLLGIPLVPPTPSGPGGTPGSPGVNFTATEPDDGFNESVNGAAISLPNVLTVGVLNVTTQATGVAMENHAGQVTTTSSVANVTVGPDLAPGVVASAVSSTCTSGGDGSTGSTSVVNLGVPGSPPITDTFSSGPVNITVPGIASIVINEQVEFETEGATAIVVNAVHITLLGVPGTAPIEIILGQSRCSAVGPDVNVTPGNVAVVKDAPADAQEVEFEFTITCPGVAGSPFTRTVTGDGTSDPVTNLSPGVVCTVSETPEAGFVDQPDQTLDPVAGGETQTVTFVNTRAPEGTGSVAVVKDAPADAQEVEFEFTITCPGVAGSPFTRTVTGDGTSAPVSGLAAGTVCTVEETPEAGFVDQPDQTLPAVVAGQTQSVTFVNTRTAAGTGNVAVVKDAPSDAQSVEFDFTITCPGAAGSPFTRTVTGDGTSAPVSGLAAGTVCTVAETTESGFEPRPDQTLPAVSAGTTQTVTFVNTRTGTTGGPDIDVDKSASPTSIPEPGGVITFTVRVTNRGNQSVTIDSLTDDVHGNLNGRGSCSTGTSIPAGLVYTCSFSANVSGVEGGTEVDRVTVTVRDPDGRTATETSNSVTVSITSRGILPDFDFPNFLFFLQPERRAPIIVTNNNSSSSSSSAAASAGGAPVAAASPQPQPSSSPAPTSRPLARTGSNSVGLSGVAMLLFVVGFLLRRNPSPAEE